MVFEVCTDSLEGAIAAGKFGAKRIELCAALSVGGLTPSFGLIQACVEKSNIEVHVIIRPREGDFNYNLQEIEIMKSDINAAKRAGAKGVVFGVLNEKNEISEYNKNLLKLSKNLGLEVTFHRAFDFVLDYKKAIQKIIDFEFDRLLTSGLQATAVEGISVIQDLQVNYGDKIQIMAGSGVNANNALQMAKTGVQNLHFTARKTTASKNSFSMGEKFVVDEEKIKAIVGKFSN
jgi:copper homeostasis protein